MTYLITNNKDKSDFHKTKELIYFTTGFKFPYNCIMLTYGDYDCVIKMPIEFSKN